MAAIDVDRVAQSLKRVERDADRQNQAKGAHFEAERGDTITAEFIGLGSVAVSFV